MTRRVLIVEDHVAHADAHRRLLEENGYAVRVVEGGRSGVEAAQYWEPDAILMDAAMPGMSGLEAVSRLRQNARTQDIPVIAAAVTPVADELTRGLLTGFTRYLTKPVSGRSLLAALDEIIDARDRLRLRELAGDLRDLTALIELEDREQVQAGLLEAIRRRIPSADVLALRCQEGGAPHVLLSLAAPAPHAPLLSQLAADLGIDPATLGRLRVVSAAATDAAPPVTPSVRARLTVPLCHADMPLGILTLGSFTRDAFEPSEEQALCELTPTVVRVCCRGLHVGGPAPVVPEDASVIEVGLVLADTAAMAFWQGRMEACLPGIRVHVFGSAEKLADSLVALHMVLVAPVMRAEAESLVRERARRWRAAFPILELCAAEVGTSDELLRAMLMMSVLVGFCDGRRSGRMVLSAEDGSQAGEIVFRDGRVEWASKEDTDTCLVRRLTERSTRDRSQFVRAVQIALSAGKPVLATVAAERLLDPETIRAVLHDYIATIMRELLRMPRVSVSISTALPAKHFDASFELGDLALGLLDA